MSTSVSLVVHLLLLLSLMTKLYISCIVTYYEYYLATYTVFSIQIAKRIAVFPVQLPISLIHQSALKFHLSNEP